MVGNDRIEFTTYIVISFLKVIIKSLKNVITDATSATQILNRKGVDGV
jgi:hypothetical protein